MIRTPRLACVLFVGSLMLMSRTPLARGDLVENAALGLSALGFDLRGTRNPIGNDVDLLITNSFRNDSLSLGVWDLTLNGPISLQMSAGGRVLSRLDFSLNTAVDRDRQSVPLTYDLFFDVGGQSRRVSGSVFIDADFSYKGLGFYDLNLAVSSQQQVVREGILGDGDDESEFDVGPISISGNVLADVLAVITDPFFEAADRPNIFDTLSGRAQLRAIFDDQADEALRQLADGGGLGGQLLEPDSTSLGATEQRLDLRLMSPLDPNTFHVTSRNTPAAVVPEPTVLLLMLLGLPAILARPRRRRRVDS